MTALSQGCTVQVGPGQPGDFDAGPAFDGATPPPVACNACLFQSCAGQYSVCANDAECFSIYQCATRVGCDATCASACYEAGTDRGRREYDALYACDSYVACTSCASSCAPGPGACVAPALDGGLPANDAAAGDDAAVVQDCATCTSASCAAEKAACAPGTPCDAYAQCLGACADVPCIDQCGAAHAEGKAASESLSACVQRSCGPACGL